MRSIEEFPTPKNIGDVRSWFGLINQVAFTFSKGAVMAPFRDLLKPSVKFEWTGELDTAFRESKVEIVRMVKDGVKMFDPELVTCLSSDFCQTGLLQINFGVSLFFFPSGGTSRPLGRLLEFVQKLS